jgi:glycosyltransferase involved in cell wall biosynthesis
MLRFAKSLRAANLHPIVLLPSKPGVLIEELRKAKIEFSTVADAWWCMRPATSFLDRWIPVARSLRVGWQVSHLLRNSGVKAVGTTTSVVPAGAIAAFLAGVRHVWHVREIYPSDVLRPTLGMAATTMLIKLLSDAIVVPSQKVAALFPNATKVQVIPEGIDDRFFDALKASKSEARQLLSIPGDSRVLTIVATIDPSKELLQAIRVLKNLVARGKDVSLVLCGACFLPDYKQKLEDEARALAVGERVHFTGFTQDVTPVYDASDVLLITSHRESFGLTVVEAMARGLPVVATRCGGPEETISDGETGFLVDIADVQTMADRAAILLDGGAAVSAMIERARTLATRFRSAENFARTLQCYGLRQGDP